MIVLVALTLAALATATPHAAFDSGIVHVQEYGNRHGRPLILIPGLGCGAWVWERQISALSARFDIYALTLPGFDGQPMVGGNRLMSRAVDSVHQLILSRRLKNTTVVGHSLGGTVAVLFAETYPRDAANIVTVEGGYPEAPTQAARNAAVRRDAAPYEHANQAQLAQTLKKNMLQYTITRPADVNRAAELMGKSDPQAIAAWMKAALVLDLTPKLPAIPVPFTAIIPFDPIIDPYQGYKTLDAKRHAYSQWVARARHGEVIVVSPSRHFVMIDRPQAFESALDSAISR